MIRVMLVDDHALVRMGFRMLLAESGDIEVVGEADSGEQALARVAELRPEVVVLDISMPGMGGLEVLRRLHARGGLRLLMLSAHDDSAHARRALDAGAAGFLSKRSAPENLPEAIRAVAAGRRWLDADIARQLALAAIDGSGAHPAERLSSREFEVFVQLARGRSVQDIAADLKLSASTIGTHLYHIKQKLEAANQAELTLLALRWGLIEA